nr:retrovirus-related Pol polyprotein from transposon TNT 1-94 [Tanacetum cinerariifolium]
MHGKLEAMSMKETEGVSDYITSVQTVVNQLNQMKRGEETISEDVASVMVEAVVEITMTKGNNEISFNKISEEEDMVTAGHFVKECKFSKRVKETTNLVNEEDVKFDGIVMMAYEVHVDGTLLMANEDVVPETNTTWYLNTGVGECSNTSQQNHMDDDEDEPRKPRMRSMQYLYDSTIEINYDEVFSPVARMETMKKIRLIISQATQLKWNIYQMGVKSTFLNCVLEEEAWNTQIGLEIRQDNYGIFVSHETYANEILKKFDMAECDPVVIPMAHGTKFSKFEGGDRVDADNFKSTPGYVFYIGDTSITWASKKQPIVTLSTCEANYVAMSWYVSHAIWLRNLLGEINLQQHRLTEIRVDNESTIELARNPIHHKRRKHKDVCLYFIRGQVRNGKVQLTLMATRDQVADIFTKAHPAELFNDFKMMLRMKDGRDLRLREDFFDDKSSHIALIAAQKGSHCLVVFEFQNRSLV